ncbi:MAG: DNA mismatch repair protein MutS, partial [Enterococcus thailandicus]|nr:DNA mismatch repair protein MutS [Enterococcus thailandicus]
AGLPIDLLKRASTILATLESGEEKHHQISVEPIKSVVKVQEEPAQTSKAQVNEETQQLSLFSELTDEEQGVVTSLKELNLLEMTPMDALNKLYDLQKQL